MTTADDHVLQLALDRGLVSAMAVESARLQLADRATVATEPAGVLELLVEEGALDLRSLAQALAADLAMPFVDIGDRQIPSDVLGVLPRSFVMRHGVCAVDRQHGTVLIAVPDPFDADVLDSLAHVSDQPITVCVAARDDLARVIARHYGREEDELAELSGGPDRQVEPAMSVRSASEGEAADSDAPIIRLVHTLIHDAVRRRASDIHLEPLARRFRVRYRIDGVMIETDSPAKRLQPAVISRLKIMANISIAEKRVPQDGRIQVNLAGRSLDLRVSSLPTAHGESIVMRLLDQKGLSLGLPELGFSGDDQRALERLIASPDGIVLVTGPTGSGKTTTLYSCLHHLNQPDRKIITVEDPVEYQLAGINQVPVRAEIGMTFASALRAMLRQAPNIVMVGEIRDAETADIAVNASLTGHLVFSTLHTNDAPSAVTRLIDIGARPFLVAAALRATMAQRLVRRVCPECRQAYTPSARELLRTRRNTGASGGRDVSARRRL